MNCKVSFAFASLLAFAVVTYPAEFLEDDLNEDVEEKEFHDKVAVLRQERKMQQQTHTHSQNREDESRDEVSEALLTDEKYAVDVQDDDTAEKVKKHIKLHEDVLSEEETKGIIPIGPDKGSEGVCCQMDVGRLTRGECECRREVSLGRYGPKICKRIVANTYMRMMLKVEDCPGNDDKGIPWYDKTHVPWSECLEGVVPSKKFLKGYRYQHVYRRIGRESC